MRKVLLRRSVYSFSANVPKDEDLMAVLNEGKLLSNAEKNQVWHFTAVENKDIVRQMYLLAKKAVENNPEISKDKTLMSGTELFSHMPMLLIISGCDVKYAEDAADTLFGSMMLAAEKHGLCSCWFSGGKDVLSKCADEMKELLQIPGDYVPMCVGAIGYKNTGGNATVTEVDSIINIIR